MTSLSQIVLPLEQSRALVEHGIVLETALVWVNVGQGWWNGGGTKVDENGYVQQIPLTPTGGYDDEVRTRGNVNALCKVLCPAPTLSELLDAIRAKHPDAEIIRRCAWPGAAFVIRYGVDGCKNSYGDTDLLATASLLMEVSK